MEDENAYPDLTDEQVTALMALLPQHKRRRVVSDIRRLLVPPTDDQIKDRIKEIQRKVAAGELFADNGDDMEREMRIEAAESKVVEAVMAEFGSSIRGWTYAMIEACAALREARKVATPPEPPR